MKKAVKYDGEKLRFDLVPPAAEEALASILTYGAKKYADRNWELGLDHSRLYGAARRHLAKYWAGQDIDSGKKGSGLPHLHHAFCCIAMLIELQRTHPELDNRPK